MVDPIQCRRRVLHSLLRTGRRREV